MLRCRFFALSLALLALPVLAQTSPPKEPDEAAPATMPPLDPRSELSADNLQRQLPTNEQQMLQVDDEIVLALWRPANAPEAHGVIILLPDNGESADWPQVISPLRQHLPDAGWHSLSLTLPDLPKLPLAVDSQAPADEKQAGATPDASPAPPADTDTPAEATQAPDTEPSAEELMQGHARQVSARLQAALAFAKTQKAKEVILLGHGDGAFWATQFLTQEKPAEVKRLLIIEPSVPAGLDQPLEAQLVALQLLIGDFYYKDQLANRQQALNRLQSSKRIKHPGYTQVALKALPGNPEVEQEQLYRRVRGWLDKSSKMIKPAPAP